MEWSVSNAVLAIQKAKLNTADEYISIIEEWKPSNTFAFPLIIDYIFCNISLHITGLQIR